MKSNVDFVLARLVSHVDPKSVITAKEFDALGSLI